MPRVETTLVLLLAMPTATFATIPSARATTEVRSDYRQPAAEHSRIERDARELAEFEQWIAELRDASRDRMTGRFRDVNTRMQAAMAREIDQAAIRSAQAQNQARLSGLAPGPERMDAGVSGDGRGLLGAFDGGYETPGRADAVTRHEEMERIGTITGSLQNGIERGERSAMERNIALAVEFVAWMRQDVAANRRERAEDRVGRR